MSAESLTGCTSANFHEAGRSEYLAHYVFSSFGTSVPIPRQEDTGLDLICTLGERDGQRLWPIASYCVQVKSTVSPWVFADPRSIRWIVQNPLPVFLCVVDKKSATISVYHTNPRFHVWVNGGELDRLELIPEESNDGLGRTWEAEDEQEITKTRYSLSAPIARFTVTDIIDERLHQSIRDVLKIWVESDKENIFRIQSGLRRLSIPFKYTTNDPRVEGNVTVQRNSVSADELQEVLIPFVENAKWLSGKCAVDKDWQAFLYIQMLLRHFDRLKYVEDSPDGYYLFSELRQEYPKEQSSRNDLFYAGLDGIRAKLSELTRGAIERADERQRDDETNCIEPDINSFGEG